MPKELESLICFWKDNLAQHRLLMIPSAIYLVEQTIKSLETLASLAAGSLFVARLKNGEWMAGRASYIYHLDIALDHYADPNLVIRNTLSDVVSLARAKVAQEKADE